MREVVKEAVAKRAKIVATGEWETASRGLPNPVESLGSCSKETAVTVEDKMLTRTDILDEIICRADWSTSISSLDPRNCWR